MKHPYQNIINALESGKALQVLKDAKNQLDDTTIRTLYAVAFPDLSDNEASQMLQEHLLDFYRYDVPFRNRIETRYTFQGTTTKNEQRKILKEAILANTEKIGSLTISRWITEFSKQFDIETRDKQDIVNFFLKHPEAEKLNEQIKTLLKDILYTYVILIESELLDIFDLVAIKKSLNKGSFQDAQETPIIAKPKNPFEENTPSQAPVISSVQQAYSSRASIESKSKTQNTQRNKLVTLPLREALEKYAKLSSMRISSYDITIKGSSQPVIPTLKNWITLYHQETGAGPHEPFERSQFLFHNKDSVLLTQSERNNISEVFRSLDENVPLTIDPVFQKIIFSEASPSQAPTPQRTQETEPLESFPEKIPTITPGPPTRETSLPTSQETISKEPQKTSLSKSKDILDNSDIMSSLPLKPSKNKTLTSTPPSHEIEKEPALNLKQVGDSLQKFSPKKSMTHSQEQSSQTDTLSKTTKEKDVPIAKIPEKSTFQEQLTRAKKRAETTPTDYTDYYPIQKKGRIQNEKRERTESKPQSDTTNSKNMQFSSPQTLPHEREEKETISKKQEDSFIIDPPKE